MQAGVGGWGACSVVQCVQYSGQAGAVVTSQAVVQQRAGRAHLSTAARPGEAEQGLLQWQPAGLLYTGGGHQRYPSLLKWQDFT